MLGFRPINPSVNNTLPCFLVLYLSASIVMLGE